MIHVTSATLFIGFLLFVSSVSSEQADAKASRSKRQAPNINVHQIPKTSFSCIDKKVGEYYADTEADCQVYHVCIPGMHNKMSLMSFVCPNGTIFNQATRVCSPFDRVDCNLALKFYNTLHGNINSGRRDAEADEDYDNYVPPAARPQPPPPPPRQQAPRQPAPARSQAQPVSRNTVPPPAPEEPIQSSRGSRFRSGANQFRGPQSRPSSTTPAPRQPVPTPRNQPAAIPSRQPVVRPGLAGFRPPVTVPRAQVPTTQPPPTTPRPTVRPVVSTSTESYNYEYEYEYDYEDEAPEQQGGTRTKREVPLSLTGDYLAEGLDMERQPQETSFSCDDKAPGGVYADIETDCEMFHICIPLSKHKMLDYKVYCANETAFDQETGACVEKAQLKCEKSQMYYQFEKTGHNPTSKKPVYKKSGYVKSSKFSTASKA